MPWQVGGYATEGEKPFDQGSFGTVWKARRVSDNARVALKLVLLTDADCRVGPTWVEGMARAFAPDVAMVLGYSELHAGPDSTLFERVQAFSS